MMTTTRHFLSLLTALAVAALGCVGCQSTRPTAQPSRSVTFTDAAQSLQITVLPSLNALRTSPQDAAPKESRWKEFLLGPEVTANRVTLPRIPQGLAIHGNRLFVCDPALPDIVTVELSTGKMKRWTTPAARPACPVDISLDLGGFAYVADTTLHALLRYDPSGSRFDQLKPERKGNEPQFRPAAVLVTADLVYVSDPRHHRVERYRPSDGAWLPPITTSDRPLLAPLGMAVTTDGILLIADALAGVVHRFDPAGQPQAPIGARGRGPGQFVRPLDVATVNGHIFVVDAARQSVQAFGANGDFLLEVGSSREWSGFTLPTAAIPVQQPLSPETDPAKLPEAKAAQWVVVSDALGPVPLTLLQISRLPPALSTVKQNSHDLTAGTITP